MPESALDIQTYKKGPGCSIEPQREEELTMAKHRQTMHPSNRLFADSQQGMFEKSYEEKLQE